MTVRVRRYIFAMFHSITLFDQEHGLFAKCLTCSAIEVADHSVERCTDEDTQERQNESDLDKEKAVQCQLSIPDEIVKHYVKSGIS